MRLLLATLSCLAVLGGCAGYALDYTKPKTSLVDEELRRYGLSETETGCVAGRLGASLSVWQLRQLQISASSVTRGFSDPNRLSLSDLRWVASTVKDKKVGTAFAAAADACVGAATAVAAAPPPGLQTVQPAQQAVTAAARTPTWVNLGAAATGQSIAVDAGSLIEDGSHRSGWFRLTNPGATRGTSSYLLKVDCAARTINSMAVRKHGADGAVTEQRELGPNGEGAAPVEEGTVMQIAFLSLCT